MKMYWASGGNSSRHFKACYWVEFCYLAACSSSFTHGERFLISSESKQNFYILMTFCCDEQTVMGNGGQSVVSLFVKHYRMIQCVMFCLSRKPPLDILKYLEKECLHTAQ